MGQVKVETVSVRKKGPVSKPQPKIEARRVVVNNQVKKLHTAVASNRSNVSSSVTKQTVKPKQTAKATTKSTAKASSKKAVKRLSQAKKQSKKK